ncbi:MAG: hypothetical protein IT425_08010 [Pirellulales bacterium]|nr:hypothetical protein [Pirellulales bacterium]
MSATLTRTLLLFALVSFTPAGVATKLHAAAPASSQATASALPQKPLTREDADLMLRETRVKIEQGRLDEAEKILGRVETAHINYSVFHVGPSPASVRRELTRAQNTAQAGRGQTATTENASSSKGFLPFARSTQPAKPKTDPFQTAAVTPASSSQPSQAAPQDRYTITPANENALPAGAGQPVVERLPQPSRYDVHPIAAANSNPAAQAGINPYPTTQSDSIPRATRTEYLSGETASDGTTDARLAQTAPQQGPQMLAPPTSSPQPLAAPATRTTEPTSNTEPTYRLASAPPTSGGARLAQSLPSLEAEAAAQAGPNPFRPATPVTEVAAPSSSPSGASIIDHAEANQQALASQLSAEIGRRQSEALRMQESDPERAIAILNEAQQMVRDSKLPESSQRELLARIDITLGKAEKYVNDHKSDIDLDKANAAVLAARDRDRETRAKIDQKVAELVEEFNRLRDEQRYAEMEIIARRLIEMAPENAVAQQVWQNAKFIRREMLNAKLASDKEASYWEQMHATESSSVNPVAKDGQELAFDQKYWGDFVKNRKGTQERTRRRTERELEIEERLKTPVLLKYENTPLSEVAAGLSELAGVNIHLDPRGLSQEGVGSDSPVTIHLTKEVSLKSALNLILSPMHLSYVVDDEVLKITSQQLRDGKIFPVTYNVADLVTPIPNFVPSSNIGLQGLINDSMAAASQGKVGFGGPTVLVNNRNQPQGAPAGNDVLAQQFNAAPATGMSPSTVPIGAGPGGMGGGANADFESLIDLIVSTVSTDTWAENGGGEAEIRPFPTNLSLVVSQTQAVHEEIADLLQQLRRLQDLQVTIEVRFIRLNDSFFERIGIDFDMDIDDHGVNNTANFQPTNPNGRSNTVGLLQAAGTNVFPNYTTDLDIPFRQDSFNLTQVVPFGGPVGGGANFGFAILSDIEAYFLIEAAQGDRRTNVLNAPKVTLFNGQQAFVADTTQRPFVIGVIPVVGEFAAAQQPVIVVLNEGTMMTIQAVVSDDRRYVRMTIVPFFTDIGDVDEFTFEGTSSSTSSSSSSTDNDDDNESSSDEESKSESRSGVTVQLPSLSFVSVVTTVSVPDGGTVLLGGIKRLSEGRNEFGVPLLSKLPYVNRLFRNVAIGRETDSLMMMVTPRIIIQEEEEERLGIASP